MTQEPIRLFLWTVIDEVTELSEAEITLRIGAQRPAYIALGWTAEIAAFLPDARNADRYVKITLDPDGADSSTAALIRAQVDYPIWDVRPGPDVTGADGIVVKGKTVIEILAGIFDSLPSKRDGAMAAKLMALRAVVSQQHALINAQQHLLESDRIGEEPNDFDDTSG